MKFINNLEANEYRLVEFANSEGIDIDREAKKEVLFFGNELKDKIFGLMAMYNSFSDKLQVALD